MVSRVALVTGASRGIGRAIASRLAQDGHAIAVNCRDIESGKEAVSEIEAAGGTAVVAPGDIRTELEQIVATAESLGAISILVNNAGITRDGLAAMMKQNAWRDVMSTNLDSAFNLSVKVLRPMLKQRWGRIINVASVVGIRGGAGQTNYAAAKAGLIGFTRALGVEVARKGITVNAVAPGLVETEMTASLSEASLAHIRALTPIGRAVTAQEVAAAVSFLASDDAAAITAQVLCIDGGMSA